MATENESTLHKSVEKSKEPSRENHISLYDVLPSLGVAEEQTGRRKSDEYLKLFQHLINQSNDAIFIVDPVTGHYIDVNKKACIMLGYTYEELLTMSVMDVQELLPDIESWRDHVANICNKGSLMFNGVHKRKDGTVFPVEVSIKYVTHEKTNYITAFARDITVLKRTLEDLEKYKLLCSQINDLAYICDHEGNIIYTNDVFETLTGFKSSDFIGKPFAPLFDESNLQEAMENFRKTLNGECPQFEVYFKDSGVLCEYKNVPLKDDNHNVIGVVGIARDITNRKKDSEKAFRENQLASIGELAAGVAHEINNPINGIINYAQILENRSEPLSREWDICSRIIKEGDRIAHIVSGLLSFARTSGEEKAALNICDILCNTLDLINMLLIKDNIKVDVTMPAQAGLVYANPEQIRQVFLNIISNARYALNQAYHLSHENKILDIYCEEINAGDHSLVKIVFYDRGAGIPKTMLKNVMNPFFTTKPGPDGTGLGLSISHSIIKEHGGELHIESEEGEFTKVTVELPVKMKEVT